MSSTCQGWERIVLQGVRPLLIFSRLGDRRLRSICAVLLVAGVFADAHPLFAQPTTSALPQPRAFAGVGGGVTNNETGLPRTEDERVYGTESRFMTWIDGGFFATRRLAVGAEWVWLGTVDVAGGSSRNQQAEQHTESAILATTRLYVGHLQQAALEIVVGGGPLFAHRVRTTRARVGRQVLAEERTTTTAVIFGADMPLTISKHFGVVPTLRGYRLLRPERPQGFSRTSVFTQFSAGVSGRVRW